MTPLLAAATTDSLVQVLLGIILAAIACVGLGAATLLIRIMLPGVARAADASIARLGSKRLFLTGLLPLVGAGLLARGAGAIGGEAAGLVLLFLVILPLGLAWVLGLVAGLPHIGAKALRADSTAAPLGRAAMGGLVAGLAMTSWALPPLGVCISLLLSAWFVGIGLGALIHRGSPTEHQM
ncbi:MAG: hypothetical protein O2894_08150 [Planctomycetota bacterium]|nr:hypothetical protein [Planctomycetota bacterium]